MRKPIFYPKDQLQQASDHYVSLKAENKYNELYFVEGIRHFDEGYFLCFEKPLIDEDKIILSYKNRMSLLTGDKTYINSHKPVKLTTNGGEPAKYYISYLRNNTQNAVIINKYLLTKNADFAQKCVVVKQYKEAYLLHEVLRIKVDTLAGILSWVQQAIFFDRQNIIDNNAN